ncbi:class I SAM-dependent RNA methyltransferase [Nocardioides mesophilus]|uniref:Class I SAM-dependent RNA methyltransferase n=1 Tax=Nocardioides mesophilus TaxID=433659 RepID=A0A7G9RBK1_9ACTN|nr:TRAM domain-containing protein [Nocardioides mesophilus]QNN52976.1 class I SAM-dependent RNA methyltransferase [Nocardioides mesophilus]
MTRQVRQRKQRGRSLVGETYEVEVGPVAHGGHCVARHDGRVLFVRHTLPGERVLARVSEGEEGSRFLRADAVEVLEASPDRVEPPCPFAGPGRCGGCDFQHVALPAQRRLKSAVVAEQLHRLAGLDVDVEVQPVPGDQDGLRWRTRVQLVTDRSGRIGLHKHRSHQVVAVDDCRIARPDARVLVDGHPVEGAGVAVAESVRGHDFEVDPAGFWQVHPGAPEALVDAVLRFLAPRPGERCLDLYAGVGLFSVFLADAVGPTGSVVAVEGERVAAEHAASNLEVFPGAAARRGSVDRDLAEDPGEPVDLVVLDPPREGAKRTVVEEIVRRGPRAVAYVACDPAALARDVAIFAEHGYAMTRLEAFDLFPMTHHVECVALLRNSR